MDYLDKLILKMNTSLNTKVYLKEKKVKKTLKNTDAVYSPLIQLIKTEFRADVKEMNLKDIKTHIFILTKKDYSKFFIRKMFIALGYYTTTTTVKCKLIHERY